MIGPSPLGSRYRMEAKIGAGGMGEVFRAFDRELSRAVALKVMRPAVVKEVDLARFRRELKALAGLGHPGVVRLYDGQVAGNCLCCVMELLSGQTLWERVRAKGLDRDELQQVLKGVLEALDHVHSAGLVHGDIKPSNIFLDEHRGPVLIDFGLVRPAADAVRSTVSIRGTPYYMAPELLQGALPSPSMDLFAVGLLGLEILLGTNLHDADGEAGIFSSLATGAYLEEARRRMNPADALARALLRAIAVEPEDRFESARAMLEDLERHSTPTPSTEVIAIPRSLRPSSSLYHLVWVVPVCALVVWASMTRRPAPVVQRPVPSATASKLALTRTRPPPQLLALLTPLPADPLSPELRDRLLSLSPLDLGPRPHAWEWWMRLDQWLEESARMLPPPRAPHAVRGRADAVQRALWRQMEARLPTRSHTQAAGDALRWVHDLPDDPISWLTFAAVLSEEGREGGARKVYQLALDTLAPGDLGAGSAPTWRRVARALTVTAGASLPGRFLALMRTADPPDADVLSGLSALSGPNRAEVLWQGIQDSALRDRCARYLSIEPWHRCFGPGRRPADWVSVLAKSKPTRDVSAALISLYLRRGDLERAEALSSALGDPVWERCLRAYREFPAKGFDRMPRKEFLRHIMRHEPEHAAAILRREAQSSVWFAEAFDLFNEGYDAPWLLEICRSGLSVVGFKLEYWVDATSVLTHGLAREWMADRLTYLSVTRSREGAVPTWAEPLLQAQGSSRRSLPVQAFGQLKRVRAAGGRPPPELVLEILLRLWLESEGKSEVLHDPGPAGWRAGEICWQSLKSGDVLKARQALETSIDELEELEGREVWRAAVVGLSYLIRARRLPTDGRLLRRLRVSAIDAEFSSWILKELGSLQESGSTPGWRKP